MTYIPYPKMLYAPGREAIIVPDAAAHAELGPEWQETPAGDGWAAPLEPGEAVTIAAAYAVNPEPEKPKRGRPRKVTA